MKLGGPDFEDADFDACGSAATSIVSSLDAKFVKVPLRELTPDMISKAKLSQYSNERSDDNLEFHDVSQINFSLQIYIDIQLERGIIGVITI
ncbi:MAG: hypothetical protein IH934_03075 [Nanoarchaeota archaeon]|nr:hypothetical protein [Nanoarchaeota archaeon]